MPVNSPAQVGDPLASGTEVGAPPESCSMSASAVHQLPALDRAQRYSIREAAEYLRISRAKLFQDIKAGKIRILKDGRRSYVPSDEIARQSTLPAAQ